MRKIKIDNKVQRKIIEMTNSKQRESQDELIEQEVEGITEFHALEFGKKTKFFFISFFVLGLINNNGYVLINSAAQDLAEKFDKKDLMGTFQLSLIVFSTIVRIVNSKYLLTFKHKNKLIWVVGAWSLGYIIFFITYRISNNNLGFILSIVGTLIIGIHTSVGGSTILGFMKGLTPNCIGGYASGTGFAGISGASIVLLAGWLGIGFDWVCAGLIPVSIIYLIVFFGIVSLKVKVDKKYQEQIGSNDEEDVLQGDDLVAKEEKDKDYNSNEELNQNGGDDIEEKEAKMNHELSKESITKCLKHVGGPIFNLSIVYFLEYMCTTSFAERANPKSTDPNADFIKKEAYKILALSYQVGVFLSRSSFQLFKFKRVGILSFLQLINFIAFFTVAYWGWLSIYWQIPLMVWVGLMGGCSYVNCMYLILADKKLRKADKEVAVNVASLFNDIGIFLASIGSLGISLWVIKDKK